jgi:DNA polymerase III subunit epsilon
MSAQSPIQQLSFVAIDFESAGAATGQTDVPIQVGIAHWSPEHGMGESFVSFLHTTQNIHWSAQKVHGITVADLAEAPSMLSLWPVIKGHLHDRVIVAHGKGTEKKFLRAFPGHGFGPWVDTLLLSRANWPEWSDHSLGALCDALQITEKVQAACPARNWHDALFDAIASLFLLEKILQQTHAGKAPLEYLLQPDQSRWHQNQLRNR